MTNKYCIQQVAGLLGIRARHLLQELKGAQIITLGSNRTRQNLYIGGNPRIYISQTEDCTMWSLAGVKLIARTLSSRGYDVPVEDAEILSELSSARG